MKLRSLTLVLVMALVLCGSLVGAQDESRKKHPIDAQIDRMMDKDPSTAGMVQAAAWGYEAWDKELNRVYQELMKVLPADAKTALKASQVQWLAFRDREFKALELIYAKFDGTMYRPMQVFDRLKIVKNRAFELIDRVTLFQEH
jgi:uncharacterized protein YecT (DUF1311 family)